ncbi:MAG: aspartyl/glutamyl-tRNA amidotransferase subunit C [Candidatus Babeliaceae bacterium]|nr:aspartyl/glutamyl-tRNA amidotransferase subunit C [Candidatus Babeliaceae bacterium]
MEINRVTLITQEELLKLAKLSCINLEPHEVEPLRKSLDAVLGYASRLQNVAAQYPEIQQTARTVNVFRQDHAVLCTDPMVEYAQAHENNYFLVPMIIKQS